jgi:hypothetical protein
MDKYPQIRETIAHVYDWIKGSQSLGAALKEQLNGHN